MLAVAPSAPVMSLLAATSWMSTTAAITSSATRDGPNATVSRSRGWRGPAAPLRPANGLEATPFYDGGGPDGDDDWSWMGTCWVRASCCGGCCSCGAGELGGAA